MKEAPAEGGVRKGGRKMARSQKKGSRLWFEDWQLKELVAIAWDFYSKPENEAAFQEWKAARDAAEKQEKPAGAGTPTSLKVTG